MCWIMFLQRMMLWGGKKGITQWGRNICVSAGIHHSPLCSSWSAMCACQHASMPACEYCIHCLSKCTCCLRQSSENGSGLRLGSMLLCTSLHHMSLSNIFAMCRARDEINPSAISPPYLLLKGSKIVPIVARSAHIVKSDNWPPVTFSQTIWSPASHSRLGEEWNGWTLSPVKISNWERWM